ncbi:MAG: DUF2207 domain-containing protein [candidate division WOR-3 bacterium]
MQILSLLIFSWYIRSFKTSIYLSPDNVARVEEIITVDFNNESRHGIYRVIPRKFRGLDLGLKILSAGNTEIPETPYTIYRSWDDLNIRIGHPQRLITGVQRYYISYEVRYAVFDSLGRDFFIWNVTGNGWPVPVESVDVTVRMESLPLPFEIKGYTGAYGEKGQNFSFKVDSSSKCLILKTKSTLMPFEGFTILLEFDKNYFVKPSKVTTIFHTILLFWPIYIPIVISILLFFKWKARGRDPYTGPFVIQYEPPQDLSPAECGTLIDEKVDPRDITAEIMYLILNGYISMEHYGYKDYILKKIKGCDATLKDHQCELLRKIFKKDYQEEDGTVKLSSLKEKFYLDYRELEKVIYRRMTKDGYFSENPQKIKAKYAFFAVAGFFGYLILTSILLRYFESFAFLVPIGAFMTVSVFLFFGNIMVVKTWKGAEALRIVRGLYEFIRTVEKDRLKRFALEKPEMFKTLLSYAIAFGEEEKWGRVFEEIYEQIKDKGSFGTISVHGFLPALSYVRTSVYSPPRSSGGGGGSGGFSGGGAGGGGGGAW